MSYTLISAFSLVKSLWITTKSHHNPIKIPWIPSCWWWNPMQIPYHSWWPYPKPNNPWNSTIGHLGTRGTGASSGPPWCSPTRHGHLREPRGFPTPRWNCMTAYPAHPHQTICGCWCFQKFWRSVLKWGYPEIFHPNFRLGFSINRYKPSVSG